MLTTLATFIFIVALSLLPAHSAHAPNPHRHHQIANRPRGELSKRFSSTRWTFYDVGLGACGKYNKASDFIVALNSAQFGGGYPGPNCFKSITLSYNGKTAQATIMDECPGCPFGGLDLSRGLFNFFASEDKGVLSGDWWFGGGGGGGGGNDGDDDDEPKPTPTKQHTTHHWEPKPTTHEPETTTKKPEPTTTSTTKKSSSTSKSHTTSSAKPSSSSKSSSSSSASSSSSSSSSAASVPTGLNAISQAVLGQANFIAAAAAA
jgi:hypothetical protein